MWNMYESRSLIRQLTNIKLTVVLLMIAKPHSSSAVHHHGEEGMHWHVAMPSAPQKNFSPRAQGASMEFPPRAVEPHSD
jgi:hypothetical protein